METVTTTRYMSNLNCFWFTRDEDNLGPLNKNLWLVAAVIVLVMCHLHIPLGMYLHVIITTEIFTHEYMYMPWAVLFGQSS